jgi:Uma2 family endonuclease
MAQLAATAKIAKKQPVQGEWTYQDYLDLPDDGRRYEIIEGVLYVTNAPDSDHQFTATEIARQLGNFVMAHKLGRVLTAPFEVHLTEKAKPVLPDVLYIRSERWPGRGIKQFKGAPDLIVEVLSPSTSRTDRVVKFSAYEQAGVSEYWIANPRSQSVEIYTLAGREYALSKEYIGEEVIESAVLPGLQIVNLALFDLT